MSVVTAAEAQDTLAYLGMLPPAFRDYPLDRNELVRILESVVALYERAEAAEAKVARLESQCAALRQCLERWVGSSAFEYMPEPGTLVYATDAALATDAGAKMLAEVNRLRWFSEEIKLSCDEKEYTAEEIVTQVEATIVGFDSGEAAG